MSGPWERYAQPQPAAPAAGPWSNYVAGSSPAPAAPAAPLDVDPAAGMSWGEKALVGAGSATARALQGIKGLLGGDTSQDEADREVYERHKAGLGFAGKAGEVAGSLGVYAPAALASAGFLPAAGAAAAIGGITTPGDVGTRAKAAAMDVAGAGAGHVLAKSLARVARPIGEAAGDVAGLEAHGIRPTFGQAMGATNTPLGKAIGRAEEAAQSVPLGGAVLRKTRARGMEDFQRATRAGALPPGAGPGAADSVDAMRTAFGDAYTNVLTSVPLPKEARLWSPNVVVPKLTATTPISTTQRADLKAFVREVQKKHLEAGGKGATAETAHAIQSEIRRAAAKFGSSQDPAQRAYGEALGDIAEDFGKAWRTNLPPEVAARVKEVDSAFARYVPVRHAAKTNPVSKAPEDYTPNVFLRALRTTDRTPNKSTFLAGDRPQQDLARMAEDVLTSRVPDSGTGERLASMAALGTAIPTAGASLLPSALTAVYGAKATQDYLMGRAAPELQEAIEMWLRQNADLIGLGAAGATE